MKRLLQSFRALSFFFLLSFILLSSLAGCGKLRGFFSHAAPENPHFVTIAWTPGKTPVAGYNVYREFQFSGPIRLTVRIVEGTQYIDRTVEGGRTYSYYVTSVDFRGLESKPSDKVSVTVPVAVTLPPKQ
jgi:hypothetical protein